MGLKEELGKYTYWQNKSPNQILKEVGTVAGGWRSVFPDRLPKWAHRVRNFFNQESFLLTRLDQRTALTETQKLSVKSRVFISMVNKNYFDAIGEHGALSGDVYKDRSGRMWFQMSAGGAIYHFKEVKHKVPEAILQTVLGQSITPIFKLVSPDGTGGSCETILKNFEGMARAEIDILNIPGVNQIIEKLPFGLGDSGGYNFGEINKPSTVVIIDNPHYRGSYNYAETVMSGLPAHEKFDIKPHEDDPNGYIKVPRPYPFSDLSDRIFPTHYKGDVIAELKW